MDPGRIPWVMPPHRQVTQAMQGSALRGPLGTRASGCFGSFTPKPDCALTCYG